jgi:Icc protein
LLIAQLTDVHIGYEPGKADELNRMRFAAVLRHLLHSPTRPAALVASGDLTDRADDASFDHLAEMFDECPFPVLPMVGNHDTRDGLLRAFPSTRSEDGFVHYAFELHGLRLIMLDTFEPGRHGGAFCDSRREWLSAELARVPDTPTVIFMHHPPIVSGIDWMDPAPDEPWIACVAAAVRGHKQIVGIHCGHLHRPISTTFEGIPLSVCPSVAPAVALDLRKIDLDRPDGRELITTEAPVYALHRWDGQRLTSHYQPVNDYNVLAHYDEKLGPMMQEMFNERG